MTRFRATIASVGLTLAATSTALAATQMDAAGFAPNSIQMGDASGHVNVVNGALTLSYPIGPAFAVDEALSYQLTLGFSSNLHRWVGDDPQYIRGRSPVGWGWVMHFGRIARRHCGGNCEYGYQAEDGGWHDLVQVADSVCPAPLPGETSACYRTDVQTGIRAQKITKTISPTVDQWIVWTRDGVERKLAHHVTTPWHCNAGESLGCQTDEDFAGWYTTQILNPIGDRTINVVYDPAYPHCMKQVWDSARDVANPTLEFDNALNDGTVSKQQVGGFTTAIRVRVDDSFTTYDLEYEWVNPVSDPCTYQQFPTPGPIVPLLRYVHVLVGGVGSAKVLTTEIEYDNNAALVPIAVKLPGALADATYAWSCIPYGQYPDDPAPPPCSCNALFEHFVYGVTEKKVSRSGTDCGNGSADCWTFVREDGNCTWGNPDPLLYPCDCPGPGQCTSKYQCVLQTNPGVVTATLPAQPDLSGYKRNTEVHWFQVGCPSGETPHPANGLVKRVESWDGPAGTGNLVQTVETEYAISTTPIIRPSALLRRTHTTFDNGKYHEVRRDEDGLDDYGNFATVIEETNEGTDQNAVIRRRTETPYDTSNVAEWFLGAVQSRTVFDDVSGVLEARVDYDWDAYGRLLRERRKGDPTGGCCGFPIGDVHVNHGWVGHERKCQVWSGGDRNPVLPDLEVDCDTLACPSNEAYYAVTQDYTMGSVSARRYVGMGWDSYHVDRYKSGAVHFAHDPWTRYQRELTYDQAGRLEDIFYWDSGVKGEEEPYDFDWPSPTRLEWGRDGVSAPRGSVDYDLYGRRAVTGVKDPKGGPAAFVRAATYDGLGNQTVDGFWCVDGGTCRSLFTKGFDPLGRPTRIERDGPAANTLREFSYDGLTTDESYWQREPGGECKRTVTYVRDGFGRLTQVVEPLPTRLTNCGDPGARTTTYGYDVLDRLTSVKQCVPGGTCQNRTFVYDGHGNLRRSNEPERGDMSYDWYDAKGHLLFERIGNSGAIHYRLYDCAERLVDESWSGGECRQRLYFYDGAYPGRRVGTLVQGLGGSTCMAPVEQTFAHDGVSGRLSATTLSINGHQFTQGYTWNRFGLLEQQTYPSSASDIDVGRPVLALHHAYEHGFLNTIGSTPGGTDFVTSILYDPSQAWSKIEYPRYAPNYPPFQITRGFDSYNRVSAIVGESGPVDTMGAPVPERPLNLTIFDYDRSGNIQGIRDEGVGQTDYFAYAGRGELLDASLASGGGAFYYTYDGFGNLLSRAGTPSTELFNVTVDPQKNQINGFTYTTTGDLEAVPGSASYVYDRYHEMVQATVTGEAPSAYEYDADGMRVMSETGTACPTSQVYSVRGPDGTLLSQFREDPACPGQVVWLRDYVHANGTFVAKAQNTTLAVPDFTAQRLNICTVQLEVGNPGHNQCRSLGVNIYKRAPTGSYNYFAPLNSTPLTAQCPTREVLLDTPGLSGACYQARAVHQNGDAGAPAAEFCFSPSPYWCHTPPDPLTGSPATQVPCAAPGPPPVNKSNKRFYFTDHLGTPRATLLYTGLLLDKAQLGPFGEELNPHLCQERLQFTGHERDAESGLDYMKARMYARMYGRFLSTDPVRGTPGNPQSWNRYTYANNSPLRFTDPTGLAAADEADRNRAAQGFATAVGTGMAQDSAARAQYTATVSTLAKTDHAGRNAAIAEARAASTAVGANLAEAMKPTNALAQHAGGTASKSNAAINEGMAAAGVAGKGLLAVGATISVVNVVIAPEGQTGRAVSQEVGAWTGALAFGAAGAKGGAALGTFLGGPIGAAIGGAVGGIGGGIGGAFAGARAGENVHELVVRP